ncbi:MAG: AraC family transcriptional regulator [Pseudomonadota bacterium]
MASRYCDHRLNLTGRRSLHAVHNHARGAHVSLNLLGYGAGVAIDPGELQDFYLLQIPLAGAARITHRGEEVEASASCATLLNPDRPTQMEWRGDCRKLMVQIDAAFLERVAVDAMGADLPGPIRFDPRVALDTRTGARLRGLALTAARAIDSGVLRLAADDLSLLAVERQLAAALLELQPSNVWHLLRASRPRPSERHLRRAISFIHAFHHADIRLEDIAKAAGIHPRTLQTAFRQTMGHTPMQFLKEVRLDRARYHLLRRHNRASVSEIAFDCGYSHLGRFSRDFRARFGQSPRDTH